MTKILFAVPVVGLLLAVAVGTALGGAKITVKEGMDMDIFMSIQSWAIYTMDAKGADGQAVDDRLDFSIRRGRLGVQGSLRPRLAYRVWMAYDNLGKDRFSANPGTPQSSENQSFYIWDAVFTWAADSTWANVTFGYFRPQVGRESITAAFQVNSFEKALENNYVREHLVGRSSGRETGVNIGGLVPMDWGMLNYNLGLFDTNHEKIAESGEGSNWSPLLVARVAFSIGDPEMKQYTQGYVINYFGKRIGVTLAANYARQGETNEWANGRNYYGGFKSNSVLGFDILANWPEWTFSAEYDELRREFTDAFVGSQAVPANRYQNNVFHFRIGYNIALANGQYLEPVAMFTRFNGDVDAAVYTGGRHQILDVGLNYYIDQNRMKINLHYIRQEGDAKSLYQSTVKKDEKGSFVGLGVQMMF